MKVKKKFKELFIIPAILGWIFMAYFPAESNQLVQKAVQNDENFIVVDKTEYDFGVISEKGGKVTTTFVITNNTEEPIIFLNVKATCGCTTPNWTKEPIEPGKTGMVNVTFDPKGFSGAFKKTITIKTNSIPEELRVYIKGAIQ